MIRKTIDKYKTFSPAVKTTIWFTICSFLQKGASFLTVPIFTRLLTTEEYGITNLYFSWFEIFVLFASLKIPYEGLNNGLIRNEEDKDGYASSMVGLMFTLTAAELIICYFLREFISEITGLSNLILFAMAVQVLLNPPLYLWINRQRFDFDYRMPTIVTVIITVLSPVIAVYAVLHTNYGAEARILSTAFVQGAFGLVIAVYLLGKGKTFYNRNYWKFAVSFNLPLLTYYLSQTVLNQSDRIMIGWYESAGKTAIYSVAYSAASAVQIVISAVNASFNPWMYKKLKNKKDGDVKRIFTELMIAFAGITILLMAFAPDVVWILAGSSYRDAVWIIPPVAVSVFFIFVYMYFANILMYNDAVRYMPMISVASACMNLGLNAILIPRAGYLAAGWTTLASYVFMAAVYLYIAGKITKQKQQNVIPYGALFGISAGLVAISLIMLIVYSFRFLRYAAIAVLAAAVVIKRKDIKQLVEQLRE